MKERKDGWMDKWKKGSRKEKGRNLFTDRL